MPRACDHSRAIEHSVVRPYLLFKSAQRILLALYLETAQVTVDYRDVGAASSVLQPQLIDHERVRSRMVSAQLLAVETRANPGIIHDGNVKRS